MEFEDLDMESPPTLPEMMTPERRSYIIHNAPMIKQWLNTLHDTALSDAVGGVNPVPGFKAVYGNAGHRKWIDKDKAAELLAAITEKSIYETKLVSPSVAEKLVGKKAFFQNIAPTAVTRSDPKPILVPEADARPAIKSTADEFEDLDAA